MVPERFPRRSCLYRKLKHETEGGNLSMSNADKR